MWRVKATRAWLGFCARCKMRVHHTQGTTRQELNTSRNSTEGADPFKLIQHAVPSFQTIQQRQFERSLPASTDAGWHHQTHLPYAALSCLLSRTAGLGPLACQHDVTYVPISLLLLTSMSSCRNTEHSHARPLIQSGPWGWGIGPCMLDIGGPRDSTRVLCRLHQAPAPPLIFTSTCRLGIVAVVDKRDSTRA